jgi:hypothetical protein
MNFFEKMGGMFGHEQPEEDPVKEERKLEVKDLDAQEKRVNDLSERIAEILTWLDDFRGNEENERSLEIYGSAIGEPLRQGKDLREMGFPTHEDATHINNMRNLMEEAWMLDAKDSLDEYLKDEELAGISDSYLDQLEEKVARAEQMIKYPTQIAKSIDHLEAFFDPHVPGSATENDETPGNVAK